LIVVILIVALVALTITIFLYNGLLVRVIRSYVIVAVTRNWRVFDITRSVLRRMLSSRVMVVSNLLIHN
jgi:hypothetical protein